MQEETQPRMSRPMQDNGPFASRDYRYYNQGASNQGAVPIFILSSVPVMSVLMCLILREKV